MGKPTEEDNVEASAYGNPGYNDLNDDTYPGGSELEKDEKVDKPPKPSIILNCFQLKKELAKIEHENKSVGAKIVGGIRNALANLLKIFLIDFFYFFLN